jgi:hypothetical protein
MIVVIQCAATKREGAGTMRTESGKPVMFVADPSNAPPDENRVYARPDDASDTGESWRDMLLRYNQEPTNNPLHLFPAFRLYRNPIYTRLVERFGEENTYILSAGWGLINASFLTPSYDITFSSSAEAYKRRRKQDRYLDLRTLPADTDEEVVFFGGKDYLPLFCALTSSLSGRKTVFYNSGTAPDAPGCSLERFATTTRTNWHYECAKAYLDHQRGIV